MTQLEDMKRKSRGDLTQSEIDFIKAKMGYRAERAKEAKAGQGDKLPAGQAAELADLSTVDSQINSMRDDWLKNFGKRDQGLGARIGSAARSLNPESQENIYEAQRRQWAQTIGVPLEGGKLTEQDYKRYLDNFIPGPFDSKERAKTKSENLREYAKEKRAQRLNAFKLAGYNVGEFNSTLPQKESALDAELRRRGLR
jgi:hypothetical protein